jgi:hypothetical protein
VSRPKGKSVVTSRWLYKTKYAADGNIEKHKARSVARGFSQIEGADYDRRSPQLRDTLISRALLTLQQRWVGGYIKWM